jgi:hypothetical protein
VTAARINDFLDDPANVALAQLHELTGLDANHLANNAVKAYAFLRTELAAGATVHLRRPGGEWLNVEHW